MDDSMELNKLFLEHCPKAANKKKKFLQKVLKHNNRKNDIIYDFFKSQSHIIRVSTTTTTIERGQRHNCDQTWL